MHCETSSRPVIDLTKHKHPRAVHVEVLRFIKGIRGPRASSVSRKQIRDWLRRTPAEAVDAALVDLVAEGKVSSGFTSLRRGNTHKRAVGYEVVSDLGNDPAVVGDHCRAIWERVKRESSC